jgi:tetratricopeptide (TPR) repeat protein
MMLAIVITAVSIGLATAQGIDSVQRGFESGLYDEALKLFSERRNAGAQTPEDTYIAAQVLLKRDDRDRAKAELNALSEHSDPAWRLIGDSAKAGIDSDTQRALTLAEQAVKESPGHFFAVYQLGGVKAQRGDWNGAAEAFARASEINPSFAYARYNAATAYSRINRPDLTASHFEAFLKLAPKAPERPAVESIMRTLRGR